MRFHETITTPNGSGIIQGLLQDPVEGTMILVAHPPGTTVTEGIKMSKNDTIWTLVAYTPAQIGIKNNLVIEM